MYLNDEIQTLLLSFRIGACIIGNNYKFSKFFLRTMYLFLAPGRLIAFPKMKRRPDIFVKR
jgi:hypothetical protein